MCFLIWSHAVRHLRANTIFTGSSWILWCFIYLCEVHKISLGFTYLLYLRIVNSNPIATITSKSCYLYKPSLFLAHSRQNYCHGIIYLYYIWEKLKCHKQQINHPIQTDGSAVRVRILESLSALSPRSRLGYIKPTQYIPMSTSILQRSPPESGNCGLMAMSQRQQA